MKEPEEHSTWILRNGLYKCGNCGRTVMYADISERNYCFQCKHDMRWYETKDGEILPTKFQHQGVDDAPPATRFVY